MTTTTAAHPALATRLVDRLDFLVREAEAEARPLELDPYRGQLFELFVLAEGAGYVREGGELDLTADALCRMLAERWGLADATRMSQRGQSKLPAENVSQMRLLWSLMRMWMEWTYAWQRWPEFHRDEE